MHPWNINNKQQLESDSFHGSSCTVTQEQKYDNALQCVRLYIANKFKVDSVKYYKLQLGNYFYYHPNKRVLMQLDQNHFKRKVSHLKKSSECKIINNKSYSLVIHYEWRKQSLYTTILGIPEMISNMVTVCDKVSHSISHIDTKMLIADLMVLILNVRDGYFTGIKFLTTLVSILTLGARAKNIKASWFTQSLSGSDLIVLLTTIGLPTKTLELVRNFSTLSGKKLLDCLGLVDLVSQTLDIAIQIIEYFVVSFQINTWIDISPLLTIVKGVFNYFTCHNKIKKVVELYTGYVKDQQIMFDPTYRDKVLKAYDELKCDNDFLAYVSNEANRYFQTTWQAFTNNVVKFARNFDATSRKEPICIVFEGEAGSGKSTMMNTFVEYFRSVNKSIYVHTVPPVEGGKDFYDDYEGQQIFVMDDVGQQSIAQWRSIINMVSPVRFPLECAAANKKNTKFFDSEVILCTTNHFTDLHGFTKADCISEPSALFRRVHVIKCSRRGQLNLEYFKYDHLGDNSWKNKFLNHYKNTTLPTKFNGNLRDGIIWLAKLYQHLDNCDKVEACNIRLSNDDFEYIKNQLDDYYDAEDKEIFSPQIFTSYWNLMHFGVPIITEFVSGVAVKIQDLSLAVFSSLSTKPIVYMFSLAASIILSMFVKQLFLENVEVLPQEIEDQWELAWAKLLAASYQSQSSLDKFSDLTQHSRVLRNRVSGEVTHAIVSGRRLLIPSHLQWDGVSVDVYQTWAHKTNNHIELELRTIRLVERFYSVDLAVYEFDGFVPMYKKCNSLFIDAPDTHNPVCYIVATNKVCPVIKGIHIAPNESSVKYADLVHTYAHKEGSGFTTPLTNSGLCGSFLVDSRGSIIGVHVAGCEDKGFMVRPEGYVKKEIRRLMLDTPESKFDLSNKVIPGFSGVRLHYDSGEIVKKYPVAKTNYVPTQLNLDYNETTRRIVQELGIAPKGPPIIEHPIKTLEEQGKKTFLQQGTITLEERKFLFDFYDRLVVEYSPVNTDEEVAFGNEVLGPLNSKSSNGYEVDDKSEFFDFQTRCILPKGKEYLQRYKENFLDDNFDIRNVLCVETFKDEIRLEEKRETPRTFRVMPLGHIFYCKKFMGNLIKHFKDNRLSTGIGVGINPYTDFDIIARKLLDCTVMGDLDFKKWDGSVPIDILQIIKDVLLVKYRGDERVFLDRLLETVIRSYVLIYDGLYATTHGVPSGTWLTLLVNSLVNGGLRALTICREGGTIEDAMSVVDYNVGDDKIFGAYGKQARMYNLHTLAAVAKSLNMECTNGDKTPVSSVSQPFSKLSFLKRKFVYHERYNKYMGALSPDTIFNTLQWYDKTKDYEVVMEGKVKAMQVESYVHGVHFYNMYKRYISDAGLRDYLLPDDRVVEILFVTSDYKLVCSLADKDISWL